MAKQLIGIVSSTKPNKTIVVTVVTKKTHPIYKKQYTNSSKYIAHDEKNECEVGYKVMIEETRPISKLKRFTLKEVIEKPEISAEDTVENITAEPTPEEETK